MAETPEAVLVMHPKQRKGLLQKIRWFDENDTPEERKLIWKLDLLIVPYALLVYWVKYLDAANLSKVLLSPYKNVNTYCNQTMHTFLA